MNVTTIHQIITQLDTIPTGATRPELETAISLIRQLRAWTDSKEVDIATRITTISDFPERNLATASRGTLRDADTIIRRAATATAMPELNNALRDGHLTSSHIDAVTRTVRQLPEPLRPAFTERSATIAQAATGTTIEEFGRILRREVQRLTPTGIDRLTEQQTNVRLHTSIDRGSGMHRYNLVLDPLTALTLDNQLHATTQTIFHDTTPPHCPTDPLEKHAFLQAHALLALLHGQRQTTGRPEAIVVIDTRQPHHTTPSEPGGPIFDFGIHVELPHRIITELIGKADIHPIITRNGVVIHAPGQLNLGRSTRIANRAQRRALRALYPTCAIPQCQTRFDNCQIHHVTWYRNGGHTDLDNLLPLCTRHHHDTHNNNWQLTLHPNRTLHIQLPDGQHITARPPPRHPS